MKKELAIELNLPQVTMHQSKFSEKCIIPFISSYRIGFTAVERKKHFNLKEIIYAKEDSTTPNICER